MKMKMLARFSLGHSLFLKWLLAEFRHKAELSPHRGAATAQGPGSSRNEAAQRSTKMVFALYLFSFYSIY